MRIFLFFLSAFICSLSAIAQNSDFATAEPINSGTSKSGKIVAGRQYYYYKTLLPADGTVTVFIEGKHTGGNTGGFQFYVYDKSRRQIESFSIGSSTAKEGDTFRDTLKIYSRAADSLYFLVYHPGGRTFDYAFQYAVLDQSKNDVEPNDTRPQAVVFESTEKPEGHIGYVADGRTDQHDYYKTLLPANGTVRVYLEGKHTGGNTGSFGFYVYDKQGRQVYGNSSIGKAGATFGTVIRDTINVFSRDKDSLYLLIYHPGGRSFQYNLRYEIVTQSANDLEPNNTFAQANALGTGQITEGQIGYIVSGVIDQNDYYKTLLPGDGTIRVIVEGTHTGGNTGSFGFYAYDKSQRQIEGKTSIGNTTAKMGDVVRDTIDIYSRAADDIYLRIYHPGGRSFSYKLSYEMIDQSINDEEPNDVPSTALSLKEKEIVQGHIGYVADGKIDQNDYYKTVLPVDGNIRVIVEGTHTGGNTGSFGFYAYDKSQRQIEGKTSIGNTTAKMGDVVRDTIDIYSRAADDIYLRIYHPGGRSFSYRLSYEMIDQSINDEEPNDVPSTALSLKEKEIVQGHIGYVADGKTDQNDYYKTVLPVDGTIRVIVEGTHTGGNTGSFGFYAYDKSQRQIESKASIGNATAKMGDVVRDTIDIYSRGADDIYLRIYHPGGRSFSYKLSYQMIDTSLNDPEPNGDFNTAAQMFSDVAVRGHLGYVADGVTDQYDYYKTLLPVDGTVTVYLEAKHTGGNNGSFAFYAYDKAKRQIIVNSSIGTGTPKPGDIIRDTIKIESRAADSLYLLVYHAGGRSFSYTMRYDMPGSLKGDREPNNTFDEATSFMLTDTLKGLLGYVQAGNTDRYDYYKAAVPQKNTVKVFVEAEHTGGTAGSFAFYAYDKNRRQLMTKAVVGNRSFTQGEIIRDTLIIPCNITDSIFITLYQSATRSLTYKVRFENFDNRPVADFTYTRTGSDFGFVNRSKNTDKFIWKLGDGATSNVKYPLHTYKPGVYNVQLIASNSSCTFQDTATKSFTVAGIEYFTPVKSGNGGDVEMQVFGGGLDSSAKMFLRKGGVSVPAIAKYTSNRGEKLGVTFDLHFANPGLYDVVIELPGQDTITYAGGFQVDSSVYPESWSEVKGPDKWRTGRLTNFNLVVGNSGNIAAHGIIVALYWPKTIDVQFSLKEYRPPNSGKVQVTLKSGEIVSHDQARLNSVYDVNTTSSIDSLFDKPYNGYVRYLYVPVIAANSTVEVPFKAASTSSTAHSFVTYTVKPNMFGSCETYNIQSSWSSPKTVEYLISGVDAIVEEAPIPKPTKIGAQVAIKTLDISQKHIDVSSKVASHRFWAWYYGADDLTDSEYHDYYKQGMEADEFAVQKMAEIALDQTVSKISSKRLKDLEDRITNTNRQISSTNRRIKGGDNVGPKRMKRNKEAAEEITELFTKNGLTVGEIENINRLLDVYKGAKKAKSVAEAQADLLKYIKENCPEHEKLIKELEEKLNKEDDIINPKEKKTESLTSYDPNAISGPGGEGAKRYVNRTRQQPFLIMFENVDTAKADAQFVRILDTLDKKVFDLSSFEFGNVSVGNKIFNVPKGRQQFLLERNLAPQRDMKVRVNASLDTATGVVDWLFTSIDPATGDVPEFFGFLPPNVTHPNGEGSVSYTVKPRNDLADGTIMRSRASIIFDENKPIPTNTWENTIDAVSPVSKITARLEDDTLIRIVYTGVDAGAGIDYYNMYFSQDNGPWLSLGGSSTDTMFVEGEPGVEYKFYAEVQDKVGNRERKSAVAEAIVTLKSCAFATPTLTASGAISFCQGDSVSLSTTSTATTLQWLKDGAIISGATAKSYTAKQNGSYTLRAIINSCTVTSSAIVVTVNGGTPPTITASGATTFCQGGSVILSTTSTAKLQWIKDGTVISGATTQSYTATQSGSYALRSGDSACSSTSSAIVVSVTAGAVIPIVTASGATTFCQGGSVILTTTSTAKLQWLKDGAAISGATNQSYTATQSGSYTLRAGEGTCTATSSAIVVTVTAGAVAPTITTSGATTFCQGGSVILSTTSTATLQWLKDGAAISGATSQTYTATQSGSYTVRSGDSACSATSSAIIVTVTAGGLAPIVTASGATTFCQGGSVTLSSSSSSGNQWYKDGTAISGATNQTYAANQSGSYTVITTVNNCSSSPSSSINIVVSAIPAKPVITVNGNTLTSSYTSGNQWYLNGAIIAGAINQQYVALVSGQYTVQTIQNGCTSSPSDVLNFTSVSPDPNALSDVLLYPNPVKDKLTIENKANRKLSIRIVNMQGAVVLYPGNINTTLGTIDMKKLSRGSYVIEVTDMVTNQVISKIIIKLN